MKIHPVIERTDDGSDTLRHPLTGETFHSSRGASGESEHVFIMHGLEATGKSEVSVLEMGFGSGLNAWLTLDHARRNGMKIHYTGVELYPVAADTAARLNYTEDPLFMELHLSPWGAEVTVTPYFSLDKIMGDFAVTEFSRTFDLVYFDAFSPDIQPELWTAGIFSRLYGAINPGGILVTYSAKGDVRRAMAGAGFRVEKLPGALGKRHMLRATKQ